MRCAWLTICTICASMVSLPTRSARITRAPVAVDGRADHTRACRFLHRHRFSGDHRFIHRARAIEHDAIDRNLFSGTNAQSISGFYIVRAGYRARSRRSFSRRAIFGLRSSSARIALDVWLRARSSSTCPSNTSVTIAAAASK